MTPAKTTEQEVLLLLADGSDYAEIAAELEISKATLHRYLRQLMKRLDARTPPHLVAKAYHLGELSPRKSAR